MGTEEPTIQMAMQLADHLLSLKLTEVERELLCTLLGDYAAAEGMIDRRVNQSLLIAVLARAAERAEKDR